LSSGENLIFQTAANWELTSRLLTETIVIHVFTCSWHVAG